MIWLAGQISLKLEGSSTSDAPPRTGTLRRATPRHPARRSGRQAIILAAVTIAAFLALAAPALAAKWEIHVTHLNPYGQIGENGVGVKDPFTRFSQLPEENFHREEGGNLYTITIEHKSGETTNTPIKVTDKFSEGLELNLPTALLSVWECGLAEKAKGAEAGLREITCKTRSGAALQLKAGEKTSLPLVAYVEGNAPNPVKNLASVEGGGAGLEPKESIPSEGQTTIEPAVPFGLYSVLTDIEEKPNSETEKLQRCENRAPNTATEKEGTEKFDNQAGGHPFCLTNELLFNFFQPRPSPSAPIADILKEIQVETPKGFVGNPQNVPQCPSVEVFVANAKATEPCPRDTAVGYIRILDSATNVSIPELLGENPFANAAGREVSPRGTSSLVYNIKPQPGHAAEFGFVIGQDVPFLFEAKVRSDGDYGVTVSTSASGRLPGGAVADGAVSTFCGYGVEETEVLNPETRIPEKSRYRCTPPIPKHEKPFLTNPTQCSEAPLWTFRADSWEEQGEPARGEAPRYATTETYANLPFSEKAPHSSAGQAPVKAARAGPKLEKCNELSFNPFWELKPESTPPAAEGATADSPTGLTVNLKIPQTNNSKTLATPDLKNSVLTFPEGLTVSPSGAEGLEACTNEQFGYGPGQEFGPESKHSEPAHPARCPSASQIGSVKVITPLLAEPLVGQVFVGQPECSPCRENQFQKEGAEDAAEGHIFRIFIQVNDPQAGVIVKLVGRTKANELTGRLESVFENQPQTPFELLELKLKGGPTASLQSPQSCGRSSLVSTLTPWSDPEGSSGPQVEEPSFNVTGCEPGRLAEASDPPAGVPFEAGTSNPAGGGYSPFDVTLTRDDREENLAGVQVKMPAGLTAKIAGVPECSEEQANAHTCPPETQIGTATAGAGPGEHPFFEHGQVYFTGPYKGSPFGLEIVIPAVAGPFNLGNVVVRQALSVNDETSAATATSDPFPQIHDGVPLRLRKVTVSLNPGFILNPTNCAEQPIAATLTSTSGQSRTVYSPYAAQGCQNLPFKPTFTASTEAKTSKALGASLKVKITTKPGEANLAKTEVQIPSILPSRLTTLQKACTDAAFNADPATCPEGSVIGTAIARSPLLSVPLTGPAILVSHGGAAFPDVMFVLQGQGIRLDVDGGTDIKGQITYSKFESVPDQPVTSFETTFPRGPHSVLTANGNLCKAHLLAPTKITAQNGAVIKQNTIINVTGCPKDPTRAQKLAAALKACKKKPKRQQAACRRRAYHLYGPAKTARKAKKANTAGVAKPASAPGSPAGQASAAPQGASPALATGGVPLKAALAADPAPETCSPQEEKLRHESMPNPEANGAPYSTLLPECRAYEMVSPAEKNGGNAEVAVEHGATLPVAPDGETVGFQALGVDFSEPLNFHGSLINVFLSQRSATGWQTRSAFAPAGLVEAPSQTGLDSDFSPDMRKAQVSCGLLGFRTGKLTCAQREGGPGAPWVSTPLYGLFTGEGTESLVPYRGASSDLRRAFLQPEVPLLRTDGIPTGAKGIYEIAGVGKSSPTLRLVNVGNQHGTEKEGELTEQIGTRTVTATGPLLGDGREHGPGLFGAPRAVNGTEYHAISENGETVFFTATPVAGQQPAGGKQTVYARVACTNTSHHCAYVEKEEEGRVEEEGTEKTEANASTGRETIAVSNPTKEDCEACTEKPEPQAATYQGASANGKKVFFTTTQKLLNKDTTTNLYEYDFENSPGKKLVLLSGDSEPEGARVQGVVRTSSNGAHVYFVAQGVPGVAPAHERLLAEGAKAGADNLYGVSTEAGEGKEAEVKFVGELCTSSEAGHSGTVEDKQCPAKPADETSSPSDELLWGASPEGNCFEPENVSQGPVACDTNGAKAGSREAQTTPDGRYLVFSTYAHFNEEDTNRAQGVYRYDFQAGKLTWISHGAPGFDAPAAAKACEEERVEGNEKSARQKNECSRVEITAMEGWNDGATADIEDWGRAISGCPAEKSRECNKEGEHDGQDVIFTSKARLAPQDLAKSAPGGNQVYLWHCGSEACPNPEQGVVSMISPGKSESPGKGVDEPPGVRGHSSMSASGADIFFTTSTKLVGQDTDELADVYDARVNGGFPAPPAETSCFPEKCQSAGSPPLFSPPASFFGQGGGSVSTVINLTPSITLHGAKVKGNSVVVTFRTSEAGNVTLTGAGLKRTTKPVKVGSNQVSVALTSAGKVDKRRHRKTKVEALFGVGPYSGHATITLTL